MKFVSELVNLYNSRVCGNPEANPATLAADLVKKVFNVKITKLIFILLLSSAVTGCAGKMVRTYWIPKTIPLAESITNPSGLYGKSIVLANRKKPALSHVTISNIVTSGGLFSEIAAPLMPWNNEINDPAVQIGNVVLQNLSFRYGLIIKNSKKTVSGISKSRVASTYKSADYVLDVLTNTSTMLSMYPIGRNVVVNYDIILRLIDTKTNKAIAQGKCRYSDYTNLTINQLTANKSAQLKRELESVETQCERNFMSYIF